MAPGAEIVKTDAEAPAGFFACEAAGLAWLAEAEAAGGARVARVHAVTATTIVLDRVVEVRPTAAAAADFGARLARTHDAGASGFGSPPPGWVGDIWIGRRGQRSAEAPTWGAFYARDRVLPFVEPAVAAASLSARDAQLVREACRLVASGAFDDADPPARLHGDLWRGNVLFAADGAVLIDPAAHGGHRETDLAMLDLFGFPHLDDLVAGYEAVHALRAGWRDRRPVHRLHPLAVHAAGHGPAYGAALADAARATLSLA